MFIHFRQYVMIIAECMQKSNENDRQVCKFLHKDGVLFHPFVIYILRLP